MNDLDHTPMDYFWNIVRIVLVLLALYGIVEVTRYIPEAQ